jgi:hypothetical protein
MKTEALGWAIVEGLYDDGRYTYPLSESPEMRAFMRYLFMYTMP